MDAAKAIEEDMREHASELERTYSMPSMDGELPTCSGTAPDHEELQQILTGLRRGFGVLAKRSLTLIEDAATLARKGDVSLGAQKGG